MSENTARTFAPITPYLAAKVLNVRLAAENIDKVVQGPQMYNYAKSGLIKSNYSTRADDEKIMLDGQSFKEWMDRYVQRLLNGESTGAVDVEKLAEQYM